MATNDYPTDEEVAQVKQWEFTTPESFVEFMAFVKSIGNYWPTDSFGWQQDGRKFSVSTGGWSGNEEILGAMQENWTFWAVCWKKHERGGHYEFELPDPAVYFKKARLA